jgi:hypothetical protein
MKIKFFFAALVALVAMSFSTLGNRPWELLGARKINYGLDRDEIMVTRAEGVFSAVQLRIKRSPINMHKLAIHYGNG